MRTFLLTWSPKNNYPWPQRNEHIKQLEAKGELIDSWSISSYKKIQIGDRVFLMRLGNEPRGIMASGYVFSAPFLTAAWNDPEKKIWEVWVDFDIIIDHEKDNILTWDLLKTIESTAQYWTPVNSGNEIKEDIAIKLEEIWSDLTNKYLRYNPLLQTAIEDNKKFYEGNPNPTTCTKYERNREARKKCLEQYGYSCQACTSNFQDTYGEIGKEFIHVHHLKLISKPGGVHEIDPIGGLLPVCANCHAMIHKREEPYTIDEIRDMIAAAKNKN